MNYELKNGETVTSYELQENAKPYPPLEGAGGGKRRGNGYKLQVTNEEFEETEETV